MFERIARYAGVGLVAVIVLSGADCTPTSSSTTAKHKAVGNVGALPLGANPTTPIPGGSDTALRTLIFNQYYNGTGNNLPMVNGITACAQTRVNCLFTNQSTSLSFPTQIPAPAGPYPGGQGGWYAWQSLNIAPTVVPQVAIPPAAAQPQTATSYLEILLEGQSTAQSVYGLITTPSYGYSNQLSGWKQIGIAYSGNATGGQTYGNYWSIIFTD